MRKLMSILTAVLILSTVCGCAEVPENLRDEPSKKESAIVSAEVSISDNISTNPAISIFDNISTNSSVSISDNISTNPSVSISDNINTTPIAAEKAEQGNISTIRSQLSLDLQKTYKNIDILNARVGTGEVMPTYDIEIGANEDFTLDKVVELLYSDRVDDIKNPKYWRYTKVGDSCDTTTEKYGYHDKPFLAEDEGVLYNKNIFVYDIDIFQPDKEKDQSFASFHYSTGNVWGSETGGDFTGEEKYWGENFPSAAVYNLDYEKPPEGLSYKMADGKEWELNEAIAYVETFWNDYLAESDPDDFEYAAKSVKVKDFGDGTYGYYFSIQRKDRNGNWYDVNHITYIHFNDDINAGKPYMVFNNNMTWCAEKEVITRYKKDYSFTLGTVTEPGDNLLTLGKASDLLSAALAPNIGLKLYAELNYIVVCKGYPYFSIWEYPVYYEDTALTTCDFEIRPFWTFRPTVVHDSNFGNPEIYFVDALSGDVLVMVRGQFEVME